MYCGYENLEFLYSLAEQDLQLRVLLRGLPGLGRGRIEGLEGGVHGGGEHGLGVGGGGRGGVGGGGVGRGGGGVLVVVLFLQLYLQVVEHALQRQYFVLVLEEKCSWVNK